MNDKATKKADDPRNAMTRKRGKPSWNQKELTHLCKMTKTRGNMEFVDSSDEEGQVGETQDVFNVVVTFGFKIIGIQLVFFEPCDHVHTTSQVPTFLPHVTTFFVRDDLGDQTWC